MNERHLLSNLSYSGLELGHWNANKSLTKLIADKNSISDKKRRCIITYRFFCCQCKFYLCSIRLKQKTSLCTPSCGSKLLTKYCANWSLRGRFLTPTLLHGPIWTFMSFSNFSSSTRKYSQIFFRKISNSHFLFQSLIY